jgi:dihydrofolate synthase/folylpolyglutamate synthase
MVDTVLRRAGHRSARYTSPHLVDLSERFVVEGQPVDVATLHRSAEDVRRAIEGAVADGTLSTQPTFFEATTAMAFDIFRHAHVETAVIEVGLGGRLDSTNVIDPVVTAITSIDFDHQKYLGNTLGEIAGEKAGIVKPGVPVVVGDMAPEARAVIERIARERGAEVIPAGTGGRDYGPIRLALRGAHQIANAHVAMRVLEVLDRAGIPVPPGAVVDGLTTVTWPGRLDHRTLPDGREVIFDAAHNPAGAAALASYLRSLDGSDGRKPTLVFGAMRDKDVDGMLGVLLPVFGRMIVTRPSNARSADPDELAARARVLAPDLPIEVVASPSAAVSAATVTSRFVVVAGSIFLLGDVMQELGV